MNRYFYSFSAVILLLLLSSCNTGSQYKEFRDFPARSGQQDVFSKFGDPIAIFKSKEDVITAFPNRFIPAHWVAKNEDPQITYAEFYKHVIGEATSGKRYWLYEAKYGTETWGIIMVLNELEQYTHQIELKPWTKGIIKKRPLSRQ